MPGIAAVLSLLSLVLGTLTLWRRRNARPSAVALMILKFAGTALAPHVALAGAAGAALALASGSGFAMLAGAAGYLLAADYVRRVAAPHDGLEQAFGTDWRRRLSTKASRRMLRRRWSWRAPRAPEPRVTRDLAFWTIPGTSRQLLCDIWQPPEGVKPSGTAIVYLHGSAWYILDKDVLTRPFFRHLAAQGHTVMDVAYRLCPEANIVGMVGDARRATAWIKANAGRFGIDPEQVVLMGASAGGHVALLAAYGPDDATLTSEEVQGTDVSVMAVVSYYGVTDLRAYDQHATALLADGPVQHSVANERSGPGPLATFMTQRLLGRTLAPEQSPPLPPHPQMMRDLVGGQPDEVPEMYDLASPIRHVGPASPPSLLFHGEHDSLVPASPARHLHQALVAAGVPAVYVEFPRTEHGFDLLYPPLLGPAGQSALYDLERFLFCVASRT